MAIQIQGGTEYLYWPRLPDGTLSSVPSYSIAPHLKLESENGDINDYKLTTQSIASFDSVLPFKFVKTENSFELFYTLNNVELTDSMWTMEHGFRREQLVSSA